jgi:hypothetical protein|tara:strand:+ start:110 stop:349 length:240 start_codon:yes stop_codon:yes gene_type:complete
MPRKTGNTNKNFKYIVKFRTNEFGKEEEKYTSYNHIRKDLNMPRSSIYFFLSDKDTARRRINRDNGKWSAIESIQKILV